MYFVQRFQRNKQMNKKTSIPRGKYYAPNKEGTLTLETPIGFFDISTKQDTTITTTAI